MITNLLWSNLIYCILIILQTPVLSLFLRKWNGVDNVCVCVCVLSFSVYWSELLLFTLSPSNHWMLTVTRRWRMELEAGNLGVHVIKEKYFNSLFKTSIVFQFQRIHKVYKYIFIIYIIYIISNVYLCIIYNLYLIYIYIMYHIYYTYIIYIYITYNIYFIYIYIMCNIINIYI